MASCGMVSLSYEDAPGWMRGLLGVLPGYTYYRGLKNRRIFAIVFFRFIHHGSVDAARYIEIWCWRCLSRQCSHARIEV
jgi:hypothetical protein